MNWSAVDEAQVIVDACELADVHLLNFSDSLRKILLSHIINFKNWLLYSD
jgi:hypothetical protein